MPRCPLCRSALVTVTFGLYPVAICTSCSARWIQDGRQQRAINQVPEPSLMAQGPSLMAQGRSQPATQPHSHARSQSSDQPTAISDVLVATSGSSSRIGDIALGTPTCSARSRQGRWALYPHGDEVVLVWPGGALAGPAVEVAGALDRLGGDGHDDVDRAAVRAIRQFLPNPAAADAAQWSSARARTWSSPAIGYWLSGPTNQPGSGDHTPASRPGPASSSPHPPIPLPDPEPAPARAA